MIREIVRAPAASADAVDIWLSIATDNLTAADRLLDRIDHSIRGLADFAYAGVRRDDLGPDLRQAVVDPYLILYRIRLDEVVEVVRIVHGRRNLAGL